MPSESRSPKAKKSVSRERKEGNRGSEQRRSSSSSSNSSRSKSRKSKRSRSNSRERNSRAYPAPYQRRQPEKISPSTKLFVTNIDSKFTKEQLETDLRALFEPFGKIKEVIVKTKQGSSNSYCFIDYDDVQSAAKAQETLKNIDFKGKELKVQFGRGERKTEDRRSDKCYICHKEGHFAKECRFNRYTGSNYGDDKYRRDDRERGRDRDHRDREYDRDRDFRDNKDHRQHRHRKYDSRSSSSSKSYRHKYDRDREDYRRRDSRRSPDKRSSNYHSSTRRH